MGTVRAAEVVMAAAAAAVDLAVMVMAAVVILPLYLRRQRWQRKSWKTLVARQGVI